MRWANVSVAVMVVIQAIGLGPGGVTLPVSAAGIDATQDLDPSFGTDGRAAVDFGAIDRPARLVTQRDGKLVVAGLTATTFGMSMMGPVVARADIGLARLLPDGALDPSFGHGGKITVPLSERAVDFGRFGLALLPDDALVVMVKELRSQDRSAALLLRFTADGMLDSSFGDGGMVDLPLDGNLDAMALRPHLDGRLVVARRGTVGRRTYSVLSRVNSDGSLDRSFGDDGRVVIEPWLLRELAVLPDGKLLVEGSWAAKFELIGFLPDGSQDESFGTRGHVAIANSGGLDDIHVLPDGMVLGVTSFGRNPGLRLSRYRADGSVDSSFGENGRIEAFSGERLLVRGLSVNARGAILVHATRGRDATRDLEQREMLARFDGSGTLDTSFGDDGRILWDARSFALGAAVILADDRVVVAGADSSEDFVLLRFRSSRS